MPTIDIPDKICPHCGGTRWYVFLEDKKYTRYECQKRKLDRCKKNQKKNLHIGRNLKRKSLEQLTDAYIKSLIRKNLGLYYDDVPQRLIDLKRKQLLLTRQLKQLEK